MVELEALDSVHGGESERRRVVDVHRISGDLMDEDTLLDKGLGQLIPFVVRPDGDTSNVSSVGLADPATPCVDVLHFIVERVAFLEYGLRSRHA